MSLDQYIALALRKERLRARIEAQRGQLAAHGVHLAKPLAAVDKLLEAGRFIKDRPWISGVAVLTALVLGRRKLLRWAARGWTVWRGWRFASRWLQQSGFIKI